MEDLTIGEEICASKVHYKTKGIAERSAKYLANKHGDKRNYAYKCPHCDGWHLSRGTDYIKKNRGKHGKGKSSK